MISRLFAKRLTLRGKFVLPISLTLVLSMTLLAGYLIQRQSDSYRREMVSSGKTMVQILAINAESSVLFESKYELDDLLKSPLQFESVEFARIINAECKVLSEVGRHDSSLIYCPTDDCREFGRDSLELKFVETPNGHELLVLQMPIFTERQVLAQEHIGMTAGIDNTIVKSATREVIGHLELGMTLDKVTRASNEARLAAVILAAAVILVTVLLLALVVGAITRPIRELVTVTDQISRGDLSRTVEITSSDEIGHLAETFNRMIESLRQSRDEIEAYNRNLEKKIEERTRQLEEIQVQLMQSEKLSAIGQLAAGVAHELNNPLGGILGYAQFTLEKLQKNVPDKTTTKEVQSYIRYLTDIEVQARRCKTIVQNLLRFSRSTKPLDTEDVDINKAIEDTVTFVEHQLHLNQIQLVTELSPTLPHLLGNTGQLQQVFTNLIINAMHASAPQSTIKVTTRHSPALGEFGGAVEIRVIDEGSGISEENLKKIFEPFFTTKEIGKGTGLGLSVSYGIIKDHGGEIAVSSTVGKGTTFTIVLPVQKPEPDSDIGKEVPALRRS